MIGDAEKLGAVPGTDQPYFFTDDPDSPEYARKLRLLFPPPGERQFVAFYDVHA